MFKGSVKAAFLGCLILGGLSSFMPLEGRGCYGGNCGSRYYSGYNNYYDEPSYEDGYYYRDRYYRDDDRYYDRGYRQNSMRKHYRDSDRNYRDSKDSNYEKASSGNYYRHYRNEPISDNYDNRNSEHVSDQELTKQIRDKLSPGWFSSDYKQVKVEVNNGVVLLQGSVKTWEDKEELEKDIRNMDGVRGLKSQISAQEPRKNNEQRDFPQDSASSAMDEQLNKKIREAVSEGWLWDNYKDVSLHTSKGVVTLEGSMDDLEDEQKLVGEIQKIEGVKQVKSNLKLNDEKESAYE